MEKQPFQTPSETLALGLKDHSEIVTKALREAQQGLTDQIEELTLLNKWTVQAALDLQKRADVSSTSSSRPPPRCRILRWRG